VRTRISGGDFTAETQRTRSFSGWRKKPGFFRKTRFLLLDADDAEFFWVEEDERRGAQNVDFRMGTDRKSSPGRGFS
jgi:hypothetical protein